MKYCNRHIVLIHKILESTTFGQFIPIIPHSYIATYLRGCFHLCLRSLPRPGPTCLSLASPCHIFASATPKRPLTQVPSEPFSYFAFSFLSLQNIKKSGPTFSAKVFNFPNILTDKKKKNYLLKLFSPFQPQVGFHRRELGQGSSSSGQWRHRWKQQC